MPFINFVERLLYYNNSFSLISAIKDLKNAYYSNFMIDQLLIPTFKRQFAVIIEGPMLEHDYTDYFIKCRNETLNQISNPTNNLIIRLDKVYIQWLNI